MQPEIDYVKIGQRIKAARQEKGYSQADLGALVGCSNNHMSHVEVGQTKVSLAMLLKLALVLDKHFDYFLLDTPYAKRDAIIDAEIADKLKQCTAMIVEDAEAVRDTYPEEYELYKRLQVKNLMAVPFWKGPLGFLVLRNPKRYAKQTSFLRMLNYVVVNSLSEYFMIETSKLTLTSPRIANDKDVYISLFGEMKIIGPKGILTESELKSPKISRMLVYLLMSKKNGVSPREMANAIWPDEDCDSVTKNCKGLVYRLQQAFGLISDCRIVESTPNGYRLNPELNITTDYQLFQMKRTNAFAANNVEQKIDLLRKAADLYAGPFFHSASSEHWIMATSVEYYYQYVSLMGELLKTLFEEKDFICVHKYAATALQFAPHSEDFYFWMIRSTMRVGHTEAARGELRMAQTKLLEEEYAVLIERLKEVGELP